MLQLTNYFWGCLLTLAFSLFISSGNATIYYVSSLGNDANAGTSENLAWKSLTKVNNFLKLSPGDEIRFKRGDEWNGTIIVRTSGTAENPIVYGAYGTGEKPKIYGSELITGWTLHSGNIYKAAYSAAVIDQLFLDDERMTLARFPNSGYFDITSVNNSTTFTSTDLSSGTNYVGATWVSRTSAYTIYSKTVTGSSSQKFTLESVPRYGLGAGEGFFLCDKLALLDAAGEWYYDTSTNTVYLWTPNGDTPANYTIRGSIYDYGVSITNISYVTIENLEIAHSSVTGVNMDNGDYITIDNNYINSPDLFGIHIPSSVSINATITNNHITKANFNGIRAFSPNIIITGNTIEETGLLQNINKTLFGTADNMGTAIYQVGTTPIIEYNRLINSGYCGINWYGANASIKYNFIDGACTMLGDGGGIYTYNAAVPMGSAGSVVMYNIIVNVNGNLAGYTEDYPSGYGIYMDNKTTNVTIQYNTISNSTVGVFLHENNNIHVQNNTFFANLIGLTAGRQAGTSYVYDNLVYGTNRIGCFVWWTNSHERLVVRDRANPVYDRNKYIHPYQSEVFSAGISSNFTVWKSKTQQDANSTFDGTALGEGETEKLLYNDSKQTKTYNPGKSIFRDIDGFRVSDTFTLKPFTSKILIGKNFNSINQNPVILEQSFNSIAPKFENDVIGKVIANDPDTGQTINYSIIRGDESGLFAINSSTGEIYAKTDIQTSKDLLIDLIVQVTDNTVNYLSDTAKVTITIIGRDTSPPTISSFTIPLTAISLDVPISTLFATDDVAVTGYILSETSIIPLSTDSGWTTIPPSGYTFLREGTISLYAWAKDSAGNVSGSISRTVVITLPDMSPTFSEYLFEESPGLTVIDSKNSNNGTIINEELRVEGVLGNGLALNGTGYINLGQCFGENVENEVSLSAWIKPNTLTGNYQGIIVHGGPNIDSYALYIRPESKSIDFITNGTTNPLFTIDNVSELWDGNWHHLVVTYNGSEKVIYLDNIAIIKIHATGKIESGWKYNLLIGAGRDEISPTLFYDGLIDEVRIYNYALTYSEIGDLYHPVNKVIKKIHTTEYNSICEGEEYMGWFETGVFERVLKRILPSTSGADSIITTNLQVNPVYKNSDKAIICEGDFYNFGIQILTATGEFTELFETVDGCDSTVILTLTVNPEYNITDKANICEGETYIFGTQALALSGKYTEVFKTVNGCDSTVILTLSVNSGFNIFDEANICEDESYFFGNQTLSISGMYTEVFKTVNGCDSTVFMKLNVYPVQNKTEEITISYNDNYLGWTEEGIYQRVLVSSTGCDSIVVTNLTVEKKLTQFIDLEKGWNIFSSLLIPTNKDMSSVMETLRIEGKLIKVQDELDNTYEELYPQTGWINSIGNLMESEGYKIRAESSCILEIKGLQIELPLSNELKQGMNIISFPIYGSINAMQVIQPLIDTGILVKVQDEKGKSIEYWSGLGWLNDIGNFNTGEGYIVQVNNNGTLTINETTEKSSLYFAENSETTYFNVQFEGNGFDHMNINVTGLNETQLTVGDEIAVFDHHICVGAIKLAEKHLSSNVVSIPASASELKMNNGFTDGNSVEVRVWDIETNKEVKVLPEIIKGELVYTRQASVFIKLKEVTDITEYINIYPNPASSKVYIQFSSIPESGDMILLQDITGKQILSHKVQKNLEIINIESLPSGMYFIKTLIKNKFTIHKMVIT